MFVYALTILSCIARFAADPAPSSRKEYPELCPDYLDPPDLTAFLERCLDI